MTATFPSFYWYDFETFGTQPSKDKPCQFAGIRTDEELNIIGEPLVIYSKPSNDLLPQPMACMITGITPQLAWEKGSIEADFTKQIHQEMSQSKTCAVGYNSMRFDSEVLRFLFYRNFYDPYAHEYQNSNSRWDLIDVMRAAYALRPEGINWPKHETGEQAGKPSFKLEQLSVANGIEHSDAHDALADVIATIEIAKKLKTAQPKLFAYALSLRNKNTVKDMLNQNMLMPLIHVSGKIPSELACTSVVTPIAFNKANANAVIAYDLRYSPTILAELSVDEIQARLFTPVSELKDPNERIHLKGIHANKSPFIAPLKTADAAAQQRAQIDIDLCMQHLEELKQIPKLKEKVQAVFDSAPLGINDAEQNLYGRFIPNQDKPLCDAVRHAPSSELATLQANFSDARLQTLFFRYKARNFPETLNEQEIQDWEDYRQTRLLHKDGGGSITLDEFEQELQTLAENYQDDDKKMQILETLSEYAAGLV